MRGTNNRMTELNEFADMYADLERMTVLSLHLMPSTSLFLFQQRSFGTPLSKVHWICKQNNQYRALEIWLATTTLATGQTAIKLVPFPGIHSITTPRW